MSFDLMAILIGGGLGLCVLGLVYVFWEMRRRKQGAEAKPGQARIGSDGSIQHDERQAPPKPRHDQIAPSEELVDVLALVGNALVLKNGTFVRMLEVSPVDLESVDPSIKAKFWMRFADAMRAIRAPLGLQIVITTRPQDIRPYLQKWEVAAHDWMARAERSANPATAARRARMATGAVETAAFLVATNEQLTPMQQRYLVVVTHNPFPEAQTGKKKEHVLNPKLAGDALDQLEENVQLVAAALSRLNLPITNLDPLAMCQALWEHNHHPRNVLGGGASPRALLDDYRAAHGLDGHGNNGNGHGPRFEVNRLEQCPTPEEFMAAATDPEALAGLLAPSALEEQPDHLRLSTVVARGYIVHDFDTRGEMDLSALLSFNADMTHTLYLHPADPASIRQQLREKETELKSGQMVDARRGAVTDWNRQAAIETTETLRAELETTMQSPFFMRWFCMVWANDLTSLEKKAQQFETRLKTMGVRFHHATRVQLNVFQSSRPVSRLAYSVKPRNMSAESLGSFFPFARREYFDPKGWHFGVHRGNGMLVCIDPFKEGQSNASQLILGTPGGGKSMYAKQLIETKLALGHRVFVLDPEREYLRQAIDHHGLYIELGKRGQPPRIVLDLEATDPWLGGLIEVGKLYEALCAKPLTEEQGNALAGCYADVMRNAGILREDPETWRREMPLLMTLVERLKETSDGWEVGRVLAYKADSLVGGHQINILDINLDSETPWESAAERLKAFVEAIMSRPLEATEFNALVRCFETTMINFHIRPDDPDSWKRPRPTLSALVAVLGNDIASESKRLAAVLEQYANGIYGHLFNHQTTINIESAQFVVFGMRTLRENVEKSLTPVFAWQVLQLVWNAVVAGGMAQPVHLFLDEAWFILEQRGAAKYLEALARSFRKYLAALYIMTQEIEGLVRSPEAKAIANVGGIRVLFGQDTDSAVQALGAVLGLTEAEQSSITRAGKGEGLLIVGNRMRIPIYVAMNPMRLQYLSTNVEQQRAVAAASGRRRDPVL